MILYYTTRQTKEKKMDTKVKASDRVEELTSLIDEKIDELIENNDWSNYLRFITTQRNYSWFNSLLIFLQDQEATFVRGYKQWEKIGRQVKKGEKAIDILAPQIARRCAEKGCSHKGRVIFNRATKNFYCPVDEGHRIGQFLTGFRDVKVFDIAQTVGEPIKMLDLKDKCGNATQEIWDALVSLAESHDFKVILAGAGSAEGYCSHERKEIVIDPSNDFGYRVKVLAHEIGHLLMHKDITDYQQQRGRYETEAEGVAWVVCEALGIHSEDDNYSFGYISIWGKDDVKKLVKESLKRIEKTSKEILDAIENVV
jgi:antirestriction protein ArdC|tara:strand:+ start:814 stop:1749 length:936 start_codon:yes stop_codon:yes gene_type:complete